MKAQIFDSSCAARGISIAGVCCVPGTADDAVGLSNVGPIVPALHGPALVATEWADIARITALCNEVIELRNDIDNDAGL
jgi:hypothetical protein